jgi:hypothetical protein
MTIDGFRERLLTHFDQFTRTLATDAGDWVVKGFVELGAFTGYFRQRKSTKNITFPYAQYAGHFIDCQPNERTSPALNVCRHAAESQARLHPKEEAMEQNVMTKAFENVKEQVGFCGIWCGSCVVGNGTLSQLTKRYKELLDRYGVQEWGPKDFDYPEFTKGLESIQGTPLCPGCLKGGGRDNCEMRTCALSKGLDECSKCGTLTTCEHTAILQHMHSGALAAGLFVKTEEGDKQELINTWTAELRNRWPSCILFHGSGSTAS